MRACDISHLHVAGLMRLHKDVFVTKWVVSITARMAGMCEEGFVIPIIVMFQNEVSSADIINRKLSMSEQSEHLGMRAIALKRLSWSAFASRASGFFVLIWDRLKLSFSVWRQQLPAEVVVQSLEGAEFEFLRYLHKLTERMHAWRNFGNKQLSPEQLPANFRVVKGLSDPPQAEYSHLVQLQDLIDAYVPQDMQRTMFAVMLSEKLVAGRMIAPAHREYVHLVTFSIL